ncbi:MAG: murein biosynthesis integral membrane protein MurJ [Candidatus Omnitrophica bacterium]|nr:murein biosynthesis integral membrane protein MurJ [Candidatus Omnitrophota bacterium]
MTNKKLIRSTGVISSATILSRILGFARDVLIAGRFGTGIYADAFWVAFRLPNTLRDMVGEGATDAAIVPILTEYRHARTQKEYWDVARVMLNLMLTVLITLSVLGVVFAPILVRVIAPGFLNDPEKFNITVLLTRMMFPYILLIGMVAYSKGVLNSFHYFLTPALAPVILNTTMILALIFLCPIIGIKGVIIGVLVGGVFQVLIQIRPLQGRGLRLSRDFKLAHPIAKRIGKLLLPRAVGAGVYQLSVLVDTILASLSKIVGAGGVSALQYSSRLVQLPVAVFGISLVTAALPKMSKEAAAKDIGALRNTINFSLRAIFTVMIPAAAGLIILARPIVSILFQRGEFTAYSTDITSSALFFYSFGLVAYAGIKILVSGYYSMGDTRTPVKTAAISLAINVVLNLILMGPLKVGGLALATSIAASINFLILYVLLVKRIGDIGTFKIFITFLKVCAATIVMVIFTVFSDKIFLTRQLPFFILVGRLLMVVVGSGVVYTISAYITRVENVHKLWKLLWDGRKKKDEG